MSRPVPTILTQCILKDRPALQSVFSDVERHLREPGLAKWQLASEKKHVSPQTVNMSHNFPPIVIIKSFVGYEKMYGLPWPLHIVNGHGQCKCLGSQSVQDIVWVNRGANSRPVARTSAEWSIHCQSSNVYIDKDRIAWYWDPAIIFSQIFFLCY